MRYRILFLTPWYPDKNLPQHGVFIRDQASVVSDRHSVTVISAKVDYTNFSFFSWTVEESVFGNLKEYRLVIKKSLPVINQVNYLLVSVWFSWKIAKKFKPDIIHGNIAYPGGIWSYCLSKLIGKPFIVSDHSSIFTDNFRSAFHRWSTLFSLRRSRAVIAVGTYAAKRIEEQLNRSIEIVPNVIHVDDYRIAQPRSVPSQFGFLGGLSSPIHRKGLDLLLNAIAPIQKEFVLHIGGSGKLLEYYKRLADSLGVSSKCRFHGFVEYVPDFMKELHFFVSASRVEAFGMVIVEAMASGLPVVTTDSGGPRDFVNGACGRIVERENVDQLCKEIEWMIDNHKTFDKEAIRMVAVTRYSPAAFFEKIQTIYSKL